MFIIYTVSVVFYLKFHHIERLWFRLEVMVCWYSKIINDRVM